MKRIFTFITMLVSFAGFSQAVTVSTTNTPDQLVNDILINSPCNSAIPGSVSVKTGTSFGSNPNGIGAFTNVSNNPNFPFKSGVVLSTGDVTKIPGTNPATPNNSILSDGDLTWAGDADLQSILLSQSSVTMASTNASYLQFEFKPTSTSLSFNFVFASESYGLFQCNFSDAFAFILTDLTDSSIAPVNLAVLPGNIPITVESIRNNLYNPSCASANASFFGSFNGQGFGPAFDFNGQTIQLTAAATVNVAHTYRIKLVIADGNNNPSYDSAVFIGANTFSIGDQVLGVDYIPANAAFGRDAICPGSPLPILQPTTPLQGGTTYSWTYDGGTAFPSPQTGPSLDLNDASLGLSPGTHTFELKYSSPGCVDITDTILVQVYPTIGAVQPPNLYASCDGAGPTRHFDLTKNTTYILNGNGLPIPPASVEITYHTSAAVDIASKIPVTELADYQQTDAQLGGGKQIWVKIKSTNSPCFEIKSFTIKHISNPVANPVPAAFTTVCARIIDPAETPEKGVFNLTTFAASILGTQNAADYKLTFHATSTNAIGNANGGIAPLSNAVITNFIRPTSSSVYARVTSPTDPTCYAWVKIDLTVTPLAHLDSVDDVIICSSTGGYHLPPLTDATAKYYKLAGGPSTPGNTPLAVNYNVTTTQKIFVYNNPGGGVCANEVSFTVTVIDLTTNFPKTGSYCTEYQLPVLDYGVYVANDTTPPGITNPPIAPYKITDTTTTTTLYIWADSTPTITPPCHETKKIEITIIPFAKLDPADYPNQFACSSYTGTNLPVDPMVTYWSGPGGTGTPITFPITVNGTLVYVYKKNGICTSETSFTVYIGASSIVTPTSVIRCSGYVLPVLAGGGVYHSTPYANPVTAGDQIYQAGQTINNAGINTIYVWTEGEPCSAGHSFTVTISLDPIPPTLFPDITGVCDYYELPAVTHLGAYYDAPNGGGTKLAEHDNPSHYLVGAGNHTIYFYQRGPGNCYVQDDFVVNVSATPIVDIFADQKICNGTYTLPTLTKPGAFYSAPGGLPGNLITTPTIGPLTSNTTETRTIYVFQAGSTPGVCDAEDSFDVTFVNTAIKPINLGNKIACDSYLLPTIVGPGAYYDQPHIIGQPDPAPLTGAALTLTNTTNATITKTIYIYSTDGAPVPCFDEQSFTVTIYKKPVIDPVTNVDVCDSYTIPAYSTFTTTPANAVTHYYKFPGGPTIPGGNQEVLPNAIITNNTNSASTTTIYVYADTGSTTCFDEKMWTITIYPKPNITAEETALANAAAVQYCSGNFTLPTLTVGTYYNAATNTPLANPTSPLLATTAVYIYAESGNAALTPPLVCPVQSANYTITINTAPVIAAADYAPVSTCDKYVLPTLSTTGAVYYTGSNKGLPIIPAGTQLNDSQTIYVYAESGTAPNICATEQPLAISIYNVDQVPDKNTCDAIFDLNAYYALTAPGAAYYSQPGGGAGNAISTVSGLGPHIVYVHGVSSDPNASGCSDETFFTVTINAPAVAYVGNITEAQTTTCDFDGPAPAGPTLPTFDLTTLDATILGTQNPALYTVQYYKTQGGADNQITSELITAPTELINVWVRVSNNSNPNDCADVQPITIYRKERAFPNIPSKISICIDPQTQIKTPATVISGYNATEYDFEWIDSLGNTVDTNPDFVTEVPGDYTLVVTTKDHLNGCASDPVSFTIIESAKPEDVTFTTFGWFTDNQKIVVNAVPYIGDGSNFLYSLDGGEPQVSNIFENVNSGAHEVTVSDANGCGSVPVPIPVHMINSPASFSPNGDNINDIWKIEGIGSSYSKLVIFDRYGRLLKETSPQNGWDGTINGKALPADDYWFKIDYNENGVLKEFKSHFSLVR